MIEKKLLDISNTAADYKEAFKRGVVPVAYARVMFLGPGGSGKSSVLDGLMNKPIRTAESTALADTLNIWYHWVEAADAAEDAWKCTDEEDELEQLALLSHQAVAINEEGAGDGGKEKTSLVQKWPVAQAEKVFQPNLENLHDGATDPKYSQLATQSQNEITKYSQLATQSQNEITQEVVQRAQQQGRGSHSNKNREVILRIWDCGGQQVFLDILSAFLTPRTMFIQVFNASQPLNSNYVESWRHKGHTYAGKEQDFTVLQLMMQWMQLIHVSLVEKKEGTLTNEDSQDGVPASKQQKCLPDFPKIMIVGTHGDQIKSKEEELQVVNELKSSCKGKAFNEIILNQIIVVDNTKAGKGKDEDPGYKEVRKEVRKFANSLCTQTPIAWVSFRKVLKKCVGSTPILSYKQIVPIAKECGIPESVVPSVLHFYHEMGVFLHYISIESLSQTVIVEPQWLIQQLCKLLMPEWYSYRPDGTDNLWQYLHKYGILVEPLYCKLWNDCGLIGKGQAIVDLLVHFDLAKTITSVPKEVCNFELMYFIPCMLKNLSQEDIHAMKKKRLQYANKQAATLHIRFTTKYVPPGFFVRLAAHLTKSKNCRPFFESGTYRNCISFYYNEIDRVIISESISGLSIQADMMRVDKRTPLLNLFSDSCLAFRNELFTICSDVLHWLQSVEFAFAFKCSCSTTDVEHFAVINDKMHQLSHVPCCEGGVCEIKSEHKLWLQEAPLTLQVNLY